MKAAVLILLTLAMFPCTGQQSGMPTEWDIRKSLDSLAAHSGRLQSVLDQLEPKTWLEKGAPEEYVAQWNSSRTQAKAIADSAKTLSRDPDRLTFALEIYFRLQSLENTLRSLGEGIRTYQNPALAELLASMVAENVPNR